MIADMKKQEILSTIRGIYLRHAVVKQFQWPVSRFPQAAGLSKREEKHCM